MFNMTTCYTRCAQCAKNQTRAKRFMQKRLDYVAAGARSRGGLLEHEHLEDGIFLWPILVILVLLLVLGDLLVILRANGGGHVRGWREGLGFCLRG